MRLFKSIQTLSAAHVESYFSIFSIYCLKVCRRSEQRRIKIVGAILVSSLRSCLEPKVWKIAENITLLIQVQKAARTDQVRVPVKMYALAASLAS